MGLADGGTGFVDHVEAAPVRRDRFEAWRAQIRADIDSEWSG